MTANDFKLDRESFDCLKTILDDSCELSVEKDFVLADYCPDIFRIQGCKAEPKIISWDVNGAKLDFELAVTLRILYESENSSTLSFVEQKLSYSKSIDLPESVKNADVRLTPVCDYINCRVVNKRRIDARGAVTVKIKVTAKESGKLLLNAFGSGIQLKRRNITCPEKLITAAKRITIVEEFELGASKPAPASMIRCSCAVLKGEQKIIAGKLVVKGDAEVTMLYSCNSQDGSEGFENMKFTIPFSQVVDVDGIDESFTTAVDISCISCEVIPKGEGQPTLEGEVVLLVSITALKLCETQAVTDAYSTRYETTLKKETLTLIGSPTEFDLSDSKSINIKPADEPISQIFDAWGELSGVSVRYDADKKEYTLLGNLKCSVIGKSESGRPFYSEREEPFERSLGKELTCSEGAVFNVNAFVRSVSFRLSDESTAELTAVIITSGSYFENTEAEFITDITVDTDKPRKREKSCALKLCRCDEGADVWELAKKYGTSVEGIEQENELDVNAPRAGEMLLIPLIS